jgi:chromosome segregation ATPase
MSMKEAYEKKLQGHLSEWRADIDKLKAKAEQSEGDAQIAYYKELEDLRTQQEKARDKLDDLRDAGENAWEDMKAGLDKSWDDLGDAMNKALARFK